MNTTSTSWGGVRSPASTCHVGRSDDTVVDELVDRLQQGDLDGVVERCAGQGPDGGDLVIGEPGVAGLRRVLAPDERRPPTGGHPQDDDVAQPVRERGPPQDVAVEREEGLGQVRVDREGLEGGVALRARAPLRRLVLGRGRQGGQGVEHLRWPLAPRDPLQARHQAAPSRAESISARTDGGVTGSRVMSTPNGDSASATALTTAGGAPIAPPSPTPL